MSCFGNGRNRRQFAIRGSVAACLNIVFKHCCYYSRTLRTSTSQTYAYSKHSCRNYTYRTRLQYTFLYFQHVLCLNSIYLPNYDSTGDLLKQRKFYELLVNLRNRRYSKNPAIDVIISVTGNVSQKKFSPILENAYPSGTNKNTVLITVSILLVNAFPTA